MTAHKPSAAFELLAPVSPFAWWRADLPASLPVLLHLPSDCHYLLRGVIVREYDLEPCAVYHRPTGARAEPVWCRPLSEILEGENWEWHPDHNEAMSELASALEAFRRVPR